MTTKKGFYFLALVTLLIGLTVGVVLAAPTTKVSGAQANGQPDDVCMLADGRPAYLEISAVPYGSNVTDMVMVSYLTRGGEFRIVFIIGMPSTPGYWSGGINGNNYAVVGHGACATSQQ